MDPVKLFDKYKDRLEKSRCEVTRCIMYLLHPSTWYPKYSDAALAEAFANWQDDARAMDTAMGTSYFTDVQMPVMPPDDAEHFVCRRMAAVTIEREMWGNRPVGYWDEDTVMRVLANPKCASHPASFYLDDVVPDILANPACATHPPSCACRLPNSRWIRPREVAELEPLGLPHAKGCMCDHDRMRCHKADEDFIKKLFKTVQNIEYDPKSPSDVYVKKLFTTEHGADFYTPCDHDIPIYACKSCNQ